MHIGIAMGVVVLVLIDVFLATERAASVGRAGEAGALLTLAPAVYESRSPGADT